MSRFKERCKLPLAIILSAALIVGFSAVVSTVPLGRFSAITAMSEDVSEIDKKNSITVADVLSDFEDIFIPEEIINQHASKVCTAICKTYTEYSVFAENCTVTLRKYNYAYLTEDDSVVIPQDAKKITDENIDILIFSQNGVSKALYYKGLTRYTIETDASVEDLSDIFS